MSEKHLSTEEKKNILRKSRSEANEEASNSADGEKATLTTFQQQVGNRAVQRLLAQRSSDGAASGGFELDDETAERINHERGSGQALDTNVQAKMNEATGQDFKDVRVHTGPQSHALNEQLSAKAFTTGSDIFFREGAYDPNSSGGQELLAHELTHVVQQRSGPVGGGSGRMSVNAPGDAYEQEADSVAKSMGGAGATPAIQRQMPEEEEEVQAKRIQRQELEEEEEVQTKALQREEAPEEEEELVQKQEAEEEEELNA